MKNLVKYIYEGRDPKYTISVVTSNVERNYLSDKQRFLYKYLRTLYKDNIILHVRGKKLSDDDLKQLSSHIEYKINMSIIDKFISDNTIEDNEVGLLVIIDDENYEFFDTSKIIKKVEYDSYNISVHSTIHKDKKSMTLYKDKEGNIIEK